LRLAITDACIFIDLYGLEIISPFFELPIEVHTSFDVLNELFDYQKKVLTPFQNSGRLIVHILSEEDRSKMYEIPFPKSLSDNDKTVIYLALKIEALLLSSDKAVRRFAKQQSIEYHGMLWILDQLVENELLKPKEAAERLTRLITENFVYQNNQELLHEMDKRLKKWNLNL
jgi:hypothetical protein